MFFTVTVTAAVPGGQCHRVQIMNPSGVQDDSDSPSLSLSRGRGGQLDSELDSVTRNLKTRGSDRRTVQEHRRREPASHGHGAMMTVQIIQANSLSQAGTAAVRHRHSRRGGGRGRGRWPNVISAGGSLHW